MTKLSGPMVPPMNGAPPRQVVILLHGYGSDGRDLIGLAGYWRDLLPEALFVAPKAPEPCAGVPGGYQWFAVDDISQVVRAEGAARARPVLVDFLRDLWVQTGLGPESTILAGFSQGAMMALHVGLSLDHPVRGIVGFSGALIPPPGFAEGEFVRPPVCLVHGDADPIVDPLFSQQAAAQLRAKGVDVQLLVEPGIGHTITPRGLDFARNFIAAVSATV